MIDIMTPFEEINPPEFDEVITELQERVKKADGVVEAAKECISEYQCDYGEAGSQEKANNKYYDAVKDYK